MLHKVGCCFALLAFGWVQASFPAAEVPLVVAVDTSKSMSSADLDSVRRAVGLAVDRLPPALPLALLAFDDQARWLVQPGGSRGQVLEAMGRLVPQGRVTVLNDALFLAARELAGGGVVLLASDGRDEGSATTPEDVARVCETNRVRVVAASVGHKVDERALRRLALITRGQLTGRLGADASAVATAVEQARAAVAADLAAVVPPPTPAPAQVTPTTVETAPAGAGLPGWLLAILAVLVIALAVATWFALRRREPELLECEKCGAPLERWETSCSRCQVAELGAAARNQQVAAPVASDEVRLDPEVFRKSPLPEGLANTLVLDEQPVLIARQRGRSARSYPLPTDQVFAVGRAPGVNSLQVDDPTVSAQHFRLVPKDGDFFVVDLDTTNGTLVNHERVRVRKLAPGDVIQVGGVTLEFSMQLRRLG